MSVPIPIPIPEHLRVALARFFPTLDLSRVRLWSGWPRWPLPWTQLLRRYIAITFGYDIYFAREVPSFDTRREIELLAHELVHVSQYERRGTAVFFILYGIEYLRRGYEQSALEVEARNRAREIVESLGKEAPPWER